MGLPRFGILVLQGRLALNVYHQGAAAVIRIQDARQRGDEEQVRLEAEATAWSFYAQAGEDISALPVFHTVQAVYQARWASKPFEEGTFEGLGAIRAVEDLGLVFGFAEMAEFPRESGVLRETPSLSTRGFRPPPGTGIVPEGIPEGWRIRPTQGEGGVWYVDPRNPGKAVRVMPGNPNSPFPSSRVPYVRWQRNGQALDANGNVVPEKLPEAHIPLEDCRFNPDLF